MTEKPFIGQMDRMILVQKEILTRNTVGEQKPALVTVIEAFANMKESSGSEDVEGKVRHLISRTYTIRYDPAVLAERAKLKVQEGGVTYNVYHVKEVGRKSHIQLLVTGYE